MKKTRKYFAILLALVMTLTALPLSGLTAFAASSGDFVYEVLSETNKTCEITGYTGNATELTIPSELDGYTVTSIGDFAFYRCSSLINISIPDSVITIGASSFSLCDLLTRIRIPKHLKSIGNSSFYSCAITDIMLPPSVTNIGESAFAYCDKLKNITVSEGVLGLADKMFLGCISLKDFTIPDTVTQIGSGAFSGCIALKNIVIPDSVTSIESMAFANCKSLSNIALPKSVTSIRTAAFSGCSTLASISIPDGVTTIGDSVFSDCYSLTSVTIPDSVINIGTAPFVGCKLLANILVDEQNQNYSSKDGILFNKEQTELICYPAGKTNFTYTIPKSVTDIDEQAFYSCDSLISITIPNSVRYIGESAFSNCSSLTNIVLPSQIARINNYVFANCTSLISITIPASVIKVDEQAFFNCSNFTVYGPSGSYAETYAAENNIPFVALTSVEDAETGVAIENTASGELPENTELVVEQVESSDTGVTYNITLTQNGAAVQPTGEVTVKIPVPDTLDGEQCAVYREEADGTYTDMNAVYQNGYMVFTTDHFSVYILTTEESTSVSLGDVNGDGIIDAADAVMIQRYDSGLTTLTDEQLAAADVNADGLVDAADAVKIQRYDAGLIASL